MLRLAQINDPEHRMRQCPHDLSGGMCQRVMIAMGLLCQPDLLIADEPTTALDVTVQSQINTLMGELSTKSSTAILLITHDLGVVAGLCDRVLVIYAGTEMESAGVHELRSEEHTSELQSRGHLVCRLLLEKKKDNSKLIW